MRALAVFDGCRSSGVACRSRRTILFIRPSHALGSVKPDQPDGPCVSAERRTGGHQIVAPWPEEEHLQVKKTGAAYAAVRGRYRAMISKNLQWDRSFAWKAPWPSAGGMWDSA